MGFESKPKYTVDGIPRNTLLYLTDVRVEVLDVVQVGEDKRLGNIKPHGNDVLGVFEGQAMVLRERLVLPEELLIVRELDHQRHVKYLLKILREHERN
eukprot:CAMPEP_0170177056 /NCGR_PEP_ID=MMETSP0040_2-20121228/9793_1 /TAXON_ID=641309 /ORGANISM="Lotharella oceanica, Strain CCMP622" /LENGTH=97 /DNA_ID=CAMNT_0010419567 /DNA_START=904 /DNA_END=1197 /DNA_ORIENTATION=+